MTKAFISWEVDYPGLVEEVEVYRGYGEQFNINNGTLIATLPSTQKTFEDTEYPDQDMLYYKVIIKRYSLDFITKYFEIVNTSYGLKKIPKPVIEKYIDNGDGEPTVISKPVTEIDHINSDWHFSGDYENMFIEQSSNKLDFTIPKIETNKRYVDVWTRVRYSGKGFHTEWSEPFHLRYDPANDKELFTVILHQHVQYP